MSEPFIAQITKIGGNIAPRGWAFCNGQLLSVAQNSALFSLLGTTYGGDGRTTFGLPDLRGRMPMHAGNGPGLTDRRLGAEGGSEDVTLNLTQVPPHNHPASGAARCADRAGTSDSPQGKVWSGSSEGDQGYADTATADMAEGAVNVTVSDSGGGQSHTNMPPFQCVHFIIALIGVFPSRN